MSVFLYAVAILCVLSSVVLKWTFFIKLIVFYEFYPDDEESFNFLTRYS